MLIQVHKWDIFCFQNVSHGFSSVSKSISNTLIDLGERNVTDVKWLLFSKYTVNQETVA